MKDEGRFL